MTITGFGQLHHSLSINRQRQINKYTILLAYDLMQFGRENLQPVTSPLIDFARDKVHPIGTIDLPITAGIPLHSNHSDGFIFSSKLSINLQRHSRENITQQDEGDPSTYHLKMKFQQKLGWEKCEVINSLLDGAI
jgi:hypothetical protein